MIISTFLTDNYFLYFTIQLHLLYIATLFNSTLVVANIFSQISTGLMDLFLW